MLCHCDVSIRVKLQITALWAHGGRTHLHFVLYFLCHAQDFKENHYLSRVLQDLGISLSDKLLVPVSGGTAWCRASGWSLRSLISKEQKICSYIRLQKSKVFLLLCVLYYQLQLCCRYKPFPKQWPFRLFHPFCFLLPKEQHSPGLDFSTHCNIQALAHPCQYSKPK